MHFAGRTSEALEAIREAEALAQRSEGRWWYAEMHRLRGVFLVTLGAEETQIETSFCEAIRIAKQQKSISLAKRAEVTYAEYQRQKASGSPQRRRTKDFADGALNESQGAAKSYQRASGVWKA